MKKLGIVYLATRRGLNYKTWGGSMLSLGPSWHSHQSGATSFAHRSLVSLVVSLDSYKNFAAILFHYCVILTGFELIKSEIQSDVVIVLQCFEWNGNKSSIFKAMMSDVCAMLGHLQLIRIIEMNMR